MLAFHIDKHQRIQFKFSREISVTVSVALQSLSIHLTLSSCICRLHRCRLCYKKGPYSSYLKPIWTTHFSRLDLWRKDMKKEQTYTRFFWIVSSEGLLKDWNTTKSHNIFSWSRTLNDRSRFCSKKLKFQRTQQLWFYLCCCGIEAGPGSNRSGGKTGRDSRKEII